MLGDPKYSTTLRGPQMPYKPGGAGEGPLAVHQHLAGFEVTDGRVPKTFQNGIGTQLPNLIESTNANEQRTRPNPPSISVMHLRLDPREPMT